MTIETLGGSPNDVAISADGSLIYAAGSWSDPNLGSPTSDGNLRVYSAETGELLHTYAIGTRLGAMDVSPDGSFAMITELSPVSGLATVYKVDLATGTFETFDFTPSDGESGPFYDVAVLADGTAMMTLGYSGSGNVRLKILDLEAGSVSDGPGVGQDSFLSASPDGTEVLVGHWNSSDAPISIYETGAGLAAHHGNYDDGVMNFNRGIQAFNQNTGMVAQFVGNNGLHIYDGDLHYQLDLSDIFPNWAYDVDAVAFDSTGQYLFVLEDSGQRILQLSTLNWAVVQTIDVGQQPAYLNDFGGRLLISPDGSYITVVTASGLVKIDNPGPAPTVPATGGDDTLSGTADLDVIDGLVGNDTIAGDAGRDFLDGGDGNDVIGGGDDDDVITGGAGNDAIDGGAGSDTAVYSDATGAVSVDLTLETAQDTGGAGTDTLTAVENIYGSAFGDTLLGNAQANVLRGQSGDDLFVGGAGNDEINGGAGFDTVDYTRESPTAAVFVNLSQFRIGSPVGTIEPGRARDAFGNIDRLSSIEHVITGAGNDTVFGSGGAETIETGAGNDALRGGGGADILIGGLGNDSYSGVVAATTIVELENEGIDQIITSEMAFSLAGHANIENLRGQLLDGQLLTGNDLNNVITGANGNDALIGGIGNDTLNGGQGDDFLDGGVGNDVLVGGTGFDIANYESASGALNINLTLVGVQDTGGAGSDNLISIEGVIGSSFGDVLTGNTAGNSLNGGAGNDKLYGGDGDDLLTGGLGDDRMYGGTGDDDYVVNDTTDYAYENADEGADEVFASIDHRLRANIEDLTLVGAAVIGKGNELGNAISGNDNANKLYGYGGDDTLDGGDGDDYLFGAEGNDVLAGGGGYDRMYGGAGDDTYFVTDTTDYAYEDGGEGTDTVIATITHQLRANVENLELEGWDDVRGYGNELDNEVSGNMGNNLLYGRDGNDQLYGNDGTDVLKGENGNDSLYGGTARDRLYGGSGADEFIFADEDFAGLTSSTCDQIHDFSQADGDIIRLEWVDANIGFEGDQSFAFIGDAAFSGAAGELRYYQASGQTYVQGDINGDGAADFMIRLDGLHSLASGDFVL